VPKLGSSYSQQPVAYCSWKTGTVFLSPTHPALWVSANYDNGVRTAENVEIALGLEPAGRRLATETPRTANGIGIGSTEAALKSAYPKIGYDPTPDPQTGETRYSLTDSVKGESGRNLLFVVKSGVVTGIVVNRNTQYLYHYCEDQG